MDNNISFSCCALITWVLASIGAVIFLLISADVIAHRHIGFGFMAFGTSCVLYLRRYSRASRRHVDQAYELGRLSAETGRIRPIR